MDPNQTPQQPTQTPQPAPAAAPPTQPTPPAPDATPPASTPAPGKPKSNKMMMIVAALGVLVVLAVVAYLMTK